MKITPNLCAIDQYLRGAVALVCFYFGTFGAHYIGDPLIQIFLLVFATLNAISFLTRWCPVYHVAGISSCKR